MLPPLVGVAVNVTLVAGQILVCEALIASEGVTVGVTVIFTVSVFEQPVVVPVNV